MKNKPKSTAIILAAGQGKRMGAKVAKQYLELAGKPLLYYSLRTFMASPEIDNIVLVVAEGEAEYVRKEVAERWFGGGERLTGTVNEGHAPYAGALTDTVNESGAERASKLTDIVSGGRERYHSVYQGLCAAGVQDSDYIFIHDAARPLIEGETISRVVEAVRHHPAIIVGMPVKDTVKRADNEDMVCETLPRESLWAVQTPQAFAAPLIRSAYQKLMDREKEGLPLGAIITDDAMVVETFAKTKVKLIRGTERNIKITTPEDLRVAEAMIKAAGG
jgi:2-C-methyl-D-erythritol 4-phosphate cytidylyltransferase